MPPGMVSDTCWEYNDKTLQHTRPPIVAKSSMTCSLPWFSLVRLESATNFKREEEVEDVAVDPQNHISD